MQGVPLRLEIGARELETVSVPAKLTTEKAARKIVVSDTESLIAGVNKALDDMQQQLLEAAVDRQSKQIIHVDNYSAFTAHLSNGAAEDNSAEFDANEPSGSVSPVFLAPWHDCAAAEAELKAKTKYTIRCFPHAHQELAKGQKCFMSGKEATHIALLARAF